VFLLFTDRTLTCADCGQQFTFTASEQQFYSDRGFTDPRRCTSCRASRKAARGDSGGYSGGRSSGGGYGNDSYGGGSIGGGWSASGGYSAGGYGGGGGGGGGDGDRGPREMFEATCSECGNTAMVPFRPTSGKPVYCNDCFAKRRA
jgi:CxxC-x17-CxxC domain-containing protein